ncbi:PfkB family carbohydrate kinase [Desulfobacterales bacterium HSG2]|nr:PfkB family carbohydrate kinase [Desulfobacterales bacterium HSG2]
MNFKTNNSPPKIVGAGLVVLDIIINNGSKTPIFNAGGTCANVLAGLSFLGWESTPVSRAGTDLAGNILINDLIKDGVNTDYTVKEENIVTPRIIEALSSDGQYAKHKFLLRCPACQSYLPRFRSPRLDAVDCLITEYSGPDVYFFDRATPSTLKLAKIYRETDALIVFEPNNFRFDDKSEEAVRLCHILKYAGDKTKRNDRNDMLKKIRDFKPPLIIKTLGELGLSFRFNDDSRWRHQKSIQSDEIFDSCGAGDWCTVGFLFYLQKLARKNNSNLSDILDYTDAVKSSLNFAQKLASLSLKFVGARGLSNSINRMKLLKHLQPLFKEIDNTDLSANSRLLKDRSPVLKQKLINNSGLCPTCLLKTE